MHWKPLWIKVCTICKMCKRVNLFKFGWFSEIFQFPFGLVCLQGCTQQITNIQESQSHILLSHILGIYRVCALPSATNPRPSSWLDLINFYPLAVCVFWHSDLLGGFRPAAFTHRFQNVIPSEQGPCKCQAKLEKRLIQAWNHDYLQSTDQ